jgi:hypothetical protein
MSHNLKLVLISNYDYLFKNKKNKEKKCILQLGLLYIHKDKSSLSKLKRIKPKVSVFDWSASFYFNDLENNQIFLNYCISSYSCRQPRQLFFFEFIKAWKFHIVSALCFPLCNENLNSFLTRWGNYSSRGNYSREETIWGNTVTHVWIWKILRIRLITFRYLLYKVCSVVNMDFG